MSLTTEGPFLAGTPITSHVDFAVLHTPVTDPPTYDPTNPTTLTFSTVSPSAAKTTYVLGTDANLVADGSTGAFRCTWTPDMGGYWLIQWHGTGAAAGYLEKRLYVAERRVP